MTYEAGAPEMARLDGYIARVTSSLRDHRSRASFAVYAFGLLTEGERKSMEPMAARMCECPDDEREMQHAHDRMIHVISRSEWDDVPVRKEAVGYALDAVKARGECVEVSIIDDTGFLKQGKHSPGVHRQYTGSAGKTANCQVAVSLTVASRSTHVPVDMELYLPQAWTEDRVRCRAAKIPDDVGYRPKWQMALLMLERAKRNGIPLGVALADSAYGDVGEFRAGLSWLQLPYAVAIHSTTTVTPLGAGGRERAPMQVRQFAESLTKKAFRRVTWREGSARSLCSRFARRRVRVAGVEQDLIIEWPEGEAKPTDFSLIAIPGQLSTKQMVRILKQRWRTERFYEDMKGELGLDHFEGRSWRGWNHHVTLALCCYAFVVAEQLRHFSLTTRGARWDDPLASAA
jgi:SRSO17 transposase